MAKSAHVHRSSLLGLGLNAHDKPTSLVEKGVLVSAALVYGRKKDKQAKKDMKGSLLIYSNQSKIFHLWRP